MLWSEGDDDAVHCSPIFTAAKTCALLHWDWFAFSSTYCYVCGLTALARSIILRLLALWRLQTLFAACPCHLSAFWYVSFHRLWLHPVPNTSSVSVSLRVGTF